MPDPPKPSNVVRDGQVMEDEYLITEEDRAEHMEWISELGVSRATVKALAKGTDLDKVADAWCPHCNKSVKVRYPDYKGMAAYFKLLFDFKLRKPSEQTDVNVTHRIVGRDLSGLSSAQLRQIASGEARLEQVEEVEWKELPPAA